ncbi:DUF4189 domain-containing protein [Pseudomonas sp. CGJS7]|uniref:DUF4189 domain-containing protein n=1 Tax=Pseudomonas sp. CGJS7 TaxID=3109348 RepID=UPI003008111D
MNRFWSVLLSRARQLALLACASLTSVANKVNAEGGCPAGMIPYQGTNTMSCGPMSSNGYDTTPSGPYWVSQWGAIAGDKASLVVGAVDSRDSKRRARADAISECETRGGSKCKVIFTYRNQCVAMVKAKTRAINVSEVDVDQAIRVGMKECRGWNDGECSVYYQACSPPVRIR